MAQPQPAAAATELLEMLQYRSRPHHRQSTHPQPSADCTWNMNPDPRLPPPPCVCRCRSPSVSVHLVPSVFVGACPGGIVADGSTRVRPSRPLRVRRCLPRRHGCRRVHSVHTSPPILSPPLRALPRPSVPLRASPCWSVSVRVPLASIRPHSRIISPHFPSNRNNWFSCFRYAAYHEYPAYISFPALFHPPLYPLSPPLTPLPAPAGAATPSPIYMEIYGGR